MNRYIHALAQFFIHMRVPFMVVIALITLVLGTSASRINIETILADLQPPHEAYIQTNNKYKGQFGSTNLVTIMVRARHGTIFQTPVLKVIQELQNDLVKVEAVNPFEIRSLASRTLTYVSASTEDITTEPFMWPDLPKNVEEMRQLRHHVVSNPVAFGHYVSEDLTSGLVTVGFYDGRIDYTKVYPQIEALLKKVQTPEVVLSVVGRPILLGVIFRTLPQTLTIVIFITLLMAVILFLTLGTLRGTVLPLVSGATAGAWSLGIVQFFGINFDPLSIVITFLIAARSVSHAVQLTMAYDDECDAGITSAREAATLALAKLFRPGMLGLAADAGAMAVVALAPIPLLQKTALIGALWLGSMVFCTIIMVPVLLSWHNGVHRRNRIEKISSSGLGRLLHGCTVIVTHHRTAIVTLFATGLILIVSSFFAAGIQIGDTQPGSPILWPDSTYNKDNVAINSHFPGTDYMFLVVEGNKTNVLKQPDVLNNIFNLQQYLEAQPQVGGTSSIVDLIRPTNMTLHEGNPRYYRIGYDVTSNAEMLYVGLVGSGTNNLGRFTTENYQDGAIQMTLRNHKGDTIRTVFKSIQRYAEEHPMKDAHYRLAGGMIAVLAAVNDVILSGELQSIALALLILFILCAIAYHSLLAGLFFLPTVVLSNTITFAYMSLNGIGLDVNTMPVAALGIGLGIDYSFYVADRIQEHYDESRNLEESIRFGLMTAGRGVVVTAFTMIIPVASWYFLSSIKFQAEMGLLIALWMSISAISALLVIPSLIYLFRPGFLIREESCVENVVELVHGTAT